MKYLPLLMLLACTDAKAQLIDKKDIPVYSCMFAAGACYGIGEAVIFHPQGDTHFWNPYIEGKSKIDAYHLARLGQYSFTLGAVVLSVNDFKHPNFWTITKKVLICSVSYYAGQQLTWQTINK